MQALSVYHIFGNTTGQRLPSIFAFHSEPAQDLMMTHCQILLPLLNNVPVFASPTFRRFSSTVSSTLPLPPLYPFPIQEEDGEGPCDHIQGVYL